MSYDTPTKFLKAVETFFKENKDKFLQISKQVIKEGITANPVFIVTLIPFGEKIGVLFKQPTENDPFYIFLTTMELLREKRIISPHNIIELKEKIGNPLKKAPIIVIYEQDTFLVFLDY